MNMLVTAEHYNRAGHTQGVCVKIINAIRARSHTRPCVPSVHTHTHTHT